MLPFFHTTGHFSYAKSAHVYLEDMKALEKHMSESEYKKFTTEGYWTIRRSDKFFSGIFTDQTIEQTLMRLLKFEGGLFRRGVTESVAHQWIQTFLFTKDLIEGVEKFTNCASAKNYQHKDSTDSRIEADLKSLKLIEKFFEQYDPFPESIDSLINIANGMSGSPETNCHQAFEKGIEIIQGISGTNYKDLKLARLKIVKTLASCNSKIKVGDNVIQIDPDVLFHRIWALKKGDEEMTHYLKWELSPFPQEYFNNFGMLKNTKSDLYSLLRKSPVNIRDPERTFFVLDEGLLIHKVRWTIGRTFSEILENYVKYILNHYGRCTIIIFDGTKPLSTKESERNRRSNRGSSVDICFTENMELQIQQDKFLQNKNNKNNIIKMLRAKLTTVEIVSKKCSADADRTIVTTALQESRDVIK